MRANNSADYVPPKLTSSRQRLWLSLDVVRGVVIALDAGSVLLAGLISFMLVGGDSRGVVLSYIIVSLVLFLIWTVSLFRKVHLYDFQSIVTWPKNARHIFFVPGIAALLLMGVLSIQGFQDVLYRNWLVVMTLITCSSIFLIRWLVSILVKKLIKNNTLGWNVALVGYSAQAERFLSRILGGDHSWWRFIGIFDDRKSRVGDALGGYSLLGDTEALFDYVRRGQIQQVVITLPWYAEERLVTLIERLQELPVTVSIGSDLIGCRFSDRRQEVVGGLRVLEIERAPLLGWSGIYKRIEDFVLSGLMIVLFSPLLLLVAAAIRIDSPGPVIFRQKRYGFNNELITVYKFRTMRHGVKKDGGFKQAVKDDVRITRIGKFLRKTSLDELPQFFNVFEGTMSLVGPRPHPVELNEEYEILLAGYNGRHKVKPGITGWAQINGWRGETETFAKMESRVEHDIFYIENWSVWFDLQILFRTAFKGWVHDNAY